MSYRLATVGNMWVWTRSIAATAAREIISYLFVSSTCGALVLELITQIKDFISQLGNDISIVWNVVLNVQYISFGNSLDLFGSVSILKCVECILISRESRAGYLQSWPSCSCHLVNPWATLSTLNLYKGYAALTSATWLGSLITQGIYTVAQWKQTLINIGTLY